MQKAQERKLCLFFIIYLCRLIAFYCKKYRTQKVVKKMLSFGGPTFKKKIIIAFYCKTCPATLISNLTKPFSKTQKYTLILFKKCLLDYEEASYFDRINLTKKLVRIWPKNFKTTNLIIGIWPKNVHNDEPYFLNLTEIHDTNKH